MVLALGVIGVAIIVAASLRPWPGALAIRALFNCGSAITAARLERHVPGGVVSRVGIRYDRTDRDALLDVHRPTGGEGRLLPTVVWVHGGGFLSGGRGDIANYAKILAARGFAAVSVDYSLAPGAIYPTPIRQVVAALTYLVREGEDLGIDPERIVLAGDSAGAQIAAQTANLIASPDYARAVAVTAPFEAYRIRGVILFCGIYDLSPMLKVTGPFSMLVKTIFWSYSGTPHFAQDTVFALMSVRNHVSAGFPPTFISVGNGDSLAPQSTLLADALRGLGVAVDTLFFPATHQPALGHEYQFNLNDKAGQDALEATTAFIRRVTG